MQVSARFNRQKCTRSVCSSSHIHPFLKAYLLRRNSPHHGPYVLCVRRWSSNVESAAASKSKTKRSLGKAAQVPVAKEAVTDQAKETVGKSRQLRFTRPSTFNYDEQRTNTSAFLSGLASVAILSLGLTFLFVPLYRIYCSEGGHGFDARFFSSGVQSEEDEENDSNSKLTAIDKPPERKKILKVFFQGDAGLSMPIAFVPLQKTMNVLVGEPCLAFFAAYNKTNRTLHGISTYNISPPEVTSYLNKIQCFCFEEQRFKPHELVEMPVFFYIHKDFLRDPLMNNVENLILTYTFFNLKRTREIIATEF